MRSAEKAALLIGFGLGGFLDFMVLHLILQWHHMISNRLPPDTLEALQRNIFWDGVGQSAMWLLTLTGIFVLLRAASNAEPMPGMLRFIGLLIFGWGVFNLLDGVINHHILALHNVREDVTDQLAWNLGFMLLAGVALPLLGWLLARRGDTAG